MIEFNSHNKNKAGINSFRIFIGHPWTYVARTIDQTSNLKSIQRIDHRRASIGWFFSLPLQLEVSNWHGCDLLKWHQFINKIFQKMKTKKSEIKQANGKVGRMVIFFVVLCSSLLYVRRSAITSTISPLKIQIKTDRWKCQITAMKFSFMSQRNCRDRMRLEWFVDIVLTSDRVCTFPAER